RCEGVPVTATAALPRTGPPARLTGWMRPVRDLGAAGREHAVRATVDGGHALVAVDAQRPGPGIGLDAPDQIGLAEQGAGQRDEGEALRHGQVHRLLAGDAPEEDEREPERGPELASPVEEVGLLVGV